MIQEEIEVHPSQQARGWPSKVVAYIDKTPIHPSHESRTKLPAYKLNERVKLGSREALITAIRNVGSKELPIFEYQLQFDDEEVSNFVPSSDLSRAQNMG